MIYQRFILAGVLALALCACSKKTQTIEPDTPTTTTEVEPAAVTKPYSVAPAPAPTQGQLTAPKRLYRYPQKPATDRNALLDEYFAAIETLPFDYGKVGSVLEAIAYTHFLVIYPEPEFEVMHSVSYHEADGRTIGELDLLVVEANTSEVVFAGEVKLSGRLERAAAKAADQLQRIQTYLRDGKVARFSHPGHWDRVIQSDQFPAGVEYARIGSQGALSAGFEYEVDITREEGDILQSRLRDSAVPAGAI